MLLGLYKISVREGNSVYLSRAHFDSTELLKRLHAFQEDIVMTFQVVTLPEHGDLYLDDAKVTPSVAFTQDDIDAELLRYDHDDSDSISDVFSFSVEIEHVSESGDKKVASPAQPLNFSIEVVPVNDQQFELVTHSPSLRVGTR